jgi:ankyrin repeat protein
MENESIDEKRKWLLKVLPICLGHFDDVEIFSTPPDPGHNHYGMLPMHYAASIGDIKMLEFLMNKGCVVDSIDNRLYTPLFYAVMFNFLNVADFLLKNGADVNATADPFHKHNTPLFDAIEIGQVKMVKFLIKNGANVNYRNRYHEMPLNIAINSKNLPLVKLLIESGANVNENRIGNYKYQPFLNYAISKVILRSSIIDIDRMKPQDRIVEFLINQDANLDFTTVSSDNEGFRCPENPLYLLALKNHLSLVRLLLQKGAPITQKEIQQLLSRGKFHPIVLLLENDITKQMPISIFLPYKIKILAAFERQIKLDQDNKTQRRENMQSVANKLGQLAISSSFTMWRSKPKPEKKDASPAQKKNQTP